MSVLVLGDFDLDLGMPVRRLEAGPADADVVAALGDALSRPGGPWALLGARERASQALIAAALRGGVAAVVLVEPTLVRRGLDAARPVQPLDVISGLTAPVQVHLAGDAPGLLPVHVADLERRLERRGIPRQVLVTPGRTSLLDGDAVTRRRVAHRARVFIEEFLGRN